MVVLVHVVCEVCHGLTASYPNLQWARVYWPKHPPHLFTTRPEGYRACTCKRRPA